MSERIFFNEAVITGDVSLNPVSLIATLKGSVTQQRAKFLTDVVIHYHPSVPASTPGQVYLAYREQPAPLDYLPVACKPLFVGPVWKKGFLRIKRDLVSAQQWLTLGDSTPWLLVRGAQGTITLTCTVLALQYSVIPPPLPEQLEDINTEAWAGPILAGLSLVFYGADMPQTNAGGVCMTIDFKKGTGVMTNNLYIRTPETKPYLCVRYGTFPSGCTFTYSSKNQGISWKSNSHVIYSMATISSNLGYIPNYYASWAAINGSASWWLETRAGSYRIEGAGGNAWRPYNMLFLYYDYGDVDIFDSKFVPSVTILPSAEQPSPSPGFKPGEVQQLPLHVSKMPSLISKYWNLSMDPTYGTQVQLLDRLEELKQQIVSWPVNTSATRALNHEEQTDIMTSECPPKEPTGLPEERDEGP